MKIIRFFKSCYLQQQSPRKIHFAARRSAIGYFQSATTGSPLPKVANRAPADCTFETSQRQLLALGSMEEIYRLAAIRTAVEGCAQPYLSPGALPTVVPPLPPPPDPNKHYKLPRKWMKDPIPEHQKHPHVSPTPAVETPNARVLKMLWRDSNGVYRLEIPGAPDDAAAPAPSPGDPRVNGRDRNIGQQQYMNMMKPYGVKWPARKVFQDIWQNFFDGHGGTLKGVIVTVTQQQQNAPYTIRVEGKAQYPYHLLTKIGASGKRHLNRQTVGHFGEGAKVVTLMLLRDFGAAEVKYASANWVLRFTLLSKPYLPDPVLGYKLEMVKGAGLAGNNLEFTLRDPNRVAQFLQGINHFKSKNSDLLQIYTYRNRMGGFALQNEPGTVHVAGQLVPRRFTDDEKERLADNLRRRRVPDIEIDDEIQAKSYQPWVPGMRIWLNRRPKHTDFDRDRTGFTAADVYHKIVTPIVRKMNDKALVGNFARCYPQWKLSAPGNLGAALLQGLVEEMRRRKITIQFPQRFVSVPAGPERAYCDELEDFGYKLFPGRYTALGMRPFHESLIHSVMGPPLAPTEKELRRLAILRYAARQFQETFLLNPESLKALAHEKETGWYAGRLKDYEPLFRTLNTNKPVCFYDRKNPQYATLPPYFKQRVMINTPSCIWWNREDFRKAIFEEVLVPFVFCLLKEQDQMALTLPASQDWIRLFLNGVMSREASHTFNQLDAMWHEDLGGPVDDGFDDLDEWED